MEIIENLQNILQNTPIIFNVWFFIFGACIASFFNVVVFRLPKMIESDDANSIKEWFIDKKLPFPKEIEQMITKDNLSFPSSHCYSCNNSLKWYHNIPILSYIFLRGKCGFCATPYSIQYPIVELIGGLIGLFVYMWFIPLGLFTFLLALIFSFICYLLLLIDIKSYLLPDSLTLSLLIIGLFAASLSITLYPIDFKESFYAACIGFFSLFFIAKIGKLIKGYDVMGEGDFKLLAALGAFIGIKGTIFTFFFAPFIGIVTWVIFKLLNKQDLTIPYGPSLIIASIIYLFIGEDILKYIL